MDSELEASNTTYNDPAPGLRRAAPPEGCAAAAEPVGSRVWSGEGSVRMCVSAAHVSYSPSVTCVEDHCDLQ